jgi:probable HAF family extracellular repeat protein
VKPRILTYIAALTLFVAPLSLPLLSAQDGGTVSLAPQEYAVQVLPGLGGLGNAASVNDFGLVAGISEPPGDPYDHAFLWRQGQPADLGTLGGYNSAVGWPNKNDIGWLAGYSETADNDPYQENFCVFSVPFGQICKGFVWQPNKEELIPLPPLPGGNNSYGFDANDRQQIVGAAENGVIDSTCGAPQVFDYEAVVWSLGPNGAPFISQQLPPIPGDAVSAATQINDEGDAVGASGPCTSLGLGVGAHAVLWHAGRALDLGSLGGITNNVAFAINNKGQVVGTSDLAGDQFFHAFLWERGAIKDLGTLPAPYDAFALAGSINDRGEVVGFSCDVNFNCHGFLRQGGVMTDLNSFLPADSPLLIMNGEDINERGEIVGQAYDSNVGDLAAVVLIPRGDDGQFENAGEANPVRRTLTLPADARETLQRQMRFGRFGFPPNPQQ